MVPEASKRVEETLRSGYIGEGPRVVEFEQALSDFLLCEPQILCTNSCTSALDLAYHLIGLGEGDEVISTPMTCLATNMPLALRKCKIVWADVDPRMGNISPESVQRLVTPQTRAIVATDWAGRPCDYDALRAVAPLVPIVEDAAHAFGARYMNDPIAMSGGDYVAWSFQAIKHLTTGDGGALKVPAYQYERARLLRWYGLDRDDSTAMRCLQQASEPGFKYQMNDIAASIGLANLPLALKLLGQRRDNAAYYSRHLPASMVAPYDPGASYWIYTILVDDPQSFEQEMAEQGIQVSQVHTRNDMQDCLPAAKYPLPGLDMFSSHMVSIPVGWWLYASDLDDVVKATLAVTGKRERVGVA
jgi:dTDP-4-amino-4,6-dideoxygalactose transaminase